MIYLLLSIELIFLSINYIIAKKDMFSPVTMTILSMTIGSLFTLFGLSGWNDTIHISTLFLFSLFFFILTLANSSSKRIVLGVGVHHKVVHFFRNKNIHENNKIVKLASIICFFMTVVYGISAFRIGIAHGGNGLNAFAYMKQAYMEGNSENLMNPIVRQFFKIVMAIGYVDGFFLLKNIVLRKKTSVNKFYVLAVISICAITIFSGSRTEIMRVFSAYLLYIVAMLRKGKFRVGITKKTTKYIIKKVLPIGLILVSIFFLSKNIVKTSDVATSDMTSFFNYIVYYFGSPVEIFNIKISYLYSKGGLFLNNTYALSRAGAQEYLGKLNYGGNVATVFQILFYQGLVKTILSLFVDFWLLSSTYKTIFARNIKEINEKAVILFAPFYFTATLAFYANCFSMAVNFSSLIVIILVIVYIYIIERVTL